MGRTWMAIVAGAVTVLMLAACGGSDGDSGGPKEPAFGGNTEAAEVDSSNMREYAYGVVGGVEMSTILDEVVLARSSRLAARTSAMSTGVAAAVTAPPPEHYDGSCGGTLDIVYRVVSESATHITMTATMTAVGYCEGGEVEDGTMLLRVTETMSGAIERSITFTDWSDTEVATGDSELFNGWITFAWAVGGDPAYGLNMVVVETKSSSSEEWWLRNMTLNRNPIDGMTWFISGEVYYDDQGYVVLDTTTPLRLKEGLEAGVIEMVGATTKGRIVHNTLPFFTLELWDGATWGGSQCFDKEWVPAACF